ncbi:MAG: hypothetical protein WBM13_00195 [Bacteroidia bacterium]
MLKSAILLFNAIALLIYQFFFAGDITVSQTAPSSAKPESEFTVELTIKKGSTTGFAKLQQELPEGFTAVEGKSNGASFTFNNQAVKFIWMSLPNDAEFTVSYKVKVAAGINGDQTIGGKFSYVTDNTKQTADIAPVTISITGDDNAVATTKSTTTTTDNSSTDNTTSDNTTTTTSDNTTTDNTSTSDNTTASNTTTANSDNGSFSCVRTVPAEAPTEFVVELNVNKGNLGGFAKLVETLPAGFTAAAIENAGGSFSFADSKVRFIWVSLPTQPEFKISYKVKGPKNSGPQSISGVFSYIEDDNTRKYDVQPSNFSIGTQVGNVASTGNSTSSDPNVLTFSNSTGSNTTTSNATNNNNTSSSNLSANTIPTPQAGVVYRVQIMALQNNRSAAYVANYYSLSSSNVQKLAEEGLNKYVLKETHTEYKSARDARENVKSRGVVAPFVTAYNSGRRITVQDALMTTSQKWYR